MDPVGVNVRRTVEQSLLISDQGVERLNQPYGTRVENVTPHLVQFAKEVIELTPDVDVWIDTTQMETNNDDGRFFNGIGSKDQAEVTTNADGQSVGVTNYLELLGNDWVNLDVSLSNDTSTSTSSSQNTTFKSERILQLLVVEVKIMEL